VVYGSPYDSDKLEFLEDLSSVLGKWQGPTLVGGGGGLSPGKNPRGKKQWSGQF
jgi:hypothetical protein